MSERDFADAFDRWLRAEGFVFRRDRMDKATTCGRGWPDFMLVAQNHVLLIELKAGDKGRLSRDQQNMHKRLADTGTHVHVCRRIEDAVVIVQEWRASLPPLPSSSPENKTPAAPVSAPLRLMQWQGETFAVKETWIQGQKRWTLLHKATAEELATLRPI